MGPCRAVLLAALAFAPAWARADGDALRVGMSGPLSGPSEKLGRSLKLGIEAYFRQVNEQGGVHGKQLSLVALDDVSGPGETGPNMRRLIDDEHVFAVLGNPGAHTAAVAVPIANEKHVPLFGALSGAALLRKTPPDRYVINLRASDAQEAAEVVRGLIEELELKPDELAFFTQQDALGDSGYQGAIAALKARGFQSAERLPHGRYPRNTLDVEGGLSRVLDPVSRPRAVILVGAAKPCAKFIKLARQYGLRALFVHLSSVVGDQLSKELGTSGENVVVTQVVPPLDADLPVVREFRARVRGDDMGYASLEGFIAAKAFVEGLKKSGPEATPETFIDTLERGELLELGLEAPLSLSPERHQLSDQVWPTVIRGGRLVALKRWAELRPFLPKP